MSKNFKERVNLNTSIKNISVVVSDAYNLGWPVSNKIIKVGSDEFNYILSTTKTKYLVKIFSAQLTDAQCQNIIDKTLSANRASVTCPEIYLCKGQTLFITTVNNVRYRLCVMEYIDGKDFYSLGQDLNDNHIIDLATNVAILHRIRTDPPFFYYNWSLINLANEFKLNGKYLTPKYKLLIGDVISKFSKVKNDKLSYAFTHSDISKGNLILSKSDRIFLIDFGASNYLPRIVDIAVCVAELCLNFNNANLSNHRMKLFLKTYEKKSKLTSYEKKNLALFMAAHFSSYLIASRKDLKESNDKNPQMIHIFENSKTGLEFILKNYKV